ncbi:sugar phosphate isomerase/epimerase [Rhizobium mongolense]
MRIALDPHMHRHLGLNALCRKTAELGYDYIELSPRDDFLPWWVRPRAHKERIAEFKKALTDHGVKLASLLPMYRWASPHEDERVAAVSYWKQAIEIAVEMGCDTMNSEFGRGPSPDRGHKSNCCGGHYTHETSEAAWWRSIEELVPVFEKHDVTLNMEPHPEDWCEASSGARHAEDHWFEECQVPLLRAAHLLLRRRHGQDDRSGRSDDCPCACRRHL